MSQSSRDIGKIIQNLRKQRAMTGEELASRAGLSQSKISKIETGFYHTLNGSEIIKLLNILDAPESILQRVRWMFDNPGSDTTIFKLSRDYLGGSLAEEQRSKRIRVFVTSLIPALLHTIPYRKALLSLQNEEDEAKANIKHTLIRQDLLWEGKRTFHFIMLHTALYTRFASRDIHLGQLDRLERMCTFNNMRIGIIPVEAGLIPIDCSSFVLFDDHTVVSALGMGEIKTTAKTNVRVHLSAFEGLEKLAHYDAAAIKLIRDTMQAFK